MAEPGDSEDGSAAPPPPAGDPKPSAFGQTRAALRGVGKALASDGARAGAGTVERLRRSTGRLDRAWWRERSRELGADARAMTAGTAGLFRRRPLIASLAMAALAGLAAMILVLAWALNDVPWEEIAAGTLEPVVVLETADGQPLVNQGAYRGAYAAYSDFPRSLIDAVTTIEDRRFFEHGGLDFRGIARAFVRNVSAGSVVEGGSTITQQLIKVSYLERDRTFKRKIQEAVIALWLDARLGKEEILTRYLNAIYLGAGATGVPAAARIYFDKEVKDLTLAESAMIAGLIRAPSALSPLSDPEAARRRTGVVLDAMAENGKIDAATAQAAKVAYAELKPTRPASRSGSWFADWAIPEGREIAGAYGGTVRFRATLVPELQRLAEEAVTGALDRYGEEYGASQAALVAMTPAGAVVAMVGGRSYADSAFNRAVQAMRQPGSTFKLFVFHAAMKAGIPMNALVDDEPLILDGWEPKNNGDRYFGRVTLAEAFARSLNAATVRLALEVGIDKVIESARELGIEAPLPNTPSLALGSAEVNLLDLTGAFASVRAGMAPVEGYGLQEFRVDGEPSSFRLGPPRKPTVDLGAEQGELVDLLNLAVERGTGREADFGAFSAGKTGTSQDYRDAWFVGFTEPLIAGVWVGNDDDSPMKGVTGGKLPAMIWKNFMEAAVALADRQEAAQAVGAPAACNVGVCSRSYRSFRASDCTYQPYGGGQRRLCEK